MLNISRRVALAAVLTMAGLGAALADDVVYTAKLNGAAEKKYLGAERERNARDPRASPALAANHAGLAPAIIGVGALDFLYSDNLEYAALLRNAGVDVTLREFPTLNHAYFSYTGVSRVSLEASQLICADLARRLHG